MSSPSDNSNNRRESAAAANGWLVIVLMALVAVLLFKTVMDTIRNRPSYAQRVVTPRGELGADEQSTIDVFDSASPSVVYIRTKGYQQEFDGTIREQEVASGTGFMWDELGHIVTNLHVVRDLFRGAQLEVQLPNNQAYDAEFVGAMSKHDVAVLKIKAEPSVLTPIMLGVSDDLKVGQKVLAIGNPFGFDRTLSTGVIGGLDRNVGTDGDSVLAGMIQTDAAINPGNSGGPLLDSAGRLIGVCTAIVSTSGASAGLGFAVAVDDVRNAVEMILQEAMNDQMPSIGISILDAETAMENGIPVRMLTGGLVILEVFPATPAEAAGLLGCRRRENRVVLGDQITAIDGRAVTTFEELRKILSSHKIGDQVVLDIVRGTRAMKVPLVLGTRMVLL